MACRISGISLGRGQPTKLFFIVEDESHGHFCYPTDGFKFCSFGIDAKYYDYGQYKFDELQPAWQEFLAFIKEKGTVTPKGENPYHDLPFDPKNEKHLEPNYLFDLMYHMRVKIKNYRGKEVVVYPWPVHKRVYDEVCLAPYTSWRGTRVTVKSTTKDFRDRMMETSKRVIASRKEELSAELKAGNINKKEFKERLRESSAWAERHSTTEIDMLLREYFYGAYWLPGPVERLGLDMVIWMAAEVNMMFHTLQENRIMVAPGMSAGQDYGFAESAKFHKRLAVIADSIHRKYRYE
jgi:hypothetical protein